MVLLYNIGIGLYHFVIRVLAMMGHTKAQLFSNGRKHWKTNIQHALIGDSRVKIWFHVSSLGEFEQARPLLESIKKDFPNYAIILTFFSPSGFEIRKQYAQADYIWYLPKDSRSNAKQWIQITQPSLVFFTKYDFWYHYLHQLDQNKIPTLLFSAVFQQRQIFFKWYGALHRKMLGFFTHLFVQDLASQTLLQSIQINNVSIAGDTRIDSVIQNAATKISYPKIEQFLSGKKLIIGGSVWKEDWQLLLKSFTLIQDEYQLILAPHDISAHTEQAIQNDISELKSACYTDENLPENCKVLILNTIGMLSKVYQYADLVWIGGGFQKSGIHNVLEPAVYGKPIGIGPNYSKFIEAQTLVKQGGILSTDNYKDWIKLSKDSNQQSLMTQCNTTFIQQNAGAVIAIMDYLKLEKCLVATP